MNRRILSFELDLDFILIAITSPLRDYRLCYHINKELNTNFRKVSDYCLNLFAGNEALQFSQYFFKIEASETEFYLIANQSATGYLIPELGTVSYFMLIKNHFDQEDLHEVMLRLKRIENVETIAELDPAKIKSNENLLF